jgi:hypothetical protein
MECGARSECKSPSIRLQLGARLPANKCRGEGNQQGSMSARFDTPRPYRAGILHSQTRR